MAQNSSDSTNESLAAPDAQSAKGKLHIDDSSCTVGYASICRVAGTAEEFVIDTAQGLRPTSRQGEMLLKIDHRIIMNPWAAKRLALAMGQAIQRYEQTYGPIEIDPRQRSKN